MSYFPYGGERTVTGNGTEKFGTYYRDATGLDYADQRYYASNWGRFNTADPYRASGGGGDPGSWNRYAYVLNDPVNYLDPNGLEGIFSFNYKVWALWVGAGSGFGTDTHVRPNSEAQADRQPQGNRDSLTSGDQGFTYLNLSGKGSRVDDIKNQLGLLLANMDNFDPDCEAWLGTNLDGGLSDVVSNVKVAVFDAVKQTGGKWLSFVTAVAGDAGYGHSRPN